MDIQQSRVPLTAEERFALEQIVTKGNIVKLDDRCYLMAEVTPMMVEFLTAIRINGRTRNLKDRRDEIHWVTEGEQVADSDQNADMTLDEAFAEFVRQRRENWGKSSLEAYQRIHRILREVLGGDVPMKAISPNRLKVVRSLICDLPRSYGKLYPDRTLREAIRLGEEQGKPKRADTTINNDLKYVGTFFEWATARWIVDRHPARQFFLPPRRRVDETRRDAFSIVDLQRIFWAPLYTGCVDDRFGFAKPGRNRPRGHRFWIPLVALYSGLRLSEILRLRREHVKTVDGVPCFHVTKNAYVREGDEDLKTPAANRLVPVHPKLLEMGFPDYVTRKSGLVFEDVGGTDLRNRVNIFSQWFNGRFLRSIGMETPKLRFHSFRHTFRDALRDVDVQIDLVRVICGWARHRHGADAAYGSGYRISVLADAMEKVNYPGLDLSHLQSE